MNRTNKFFCITGSILLLMMAVFHGSGTFLITAEVSDSNVPAFIKDIFPILFAHISIHLIGLSVFGIAVTFLSQGARLILAPLIGMVAVDVAIAIYLNAVLPGVLLLLAATCFGIGAFTPFSKKQ